MFIRCVVVLHLALLLLVNADAMNSACSCSPALMVPSELGAQTLHPGCYASMSDAAFGLTGTLTLSGSGIYTLRTPAALTTAANRFNIIY